MGKRPKLAKSIHGRMVGVRITSTGPEPVEVHQESEALYIITEHDKKRCPFCGAKKCLHNLATSRSTSFPWKENSIGADLCRCHGTGDFFLTLHYGGIDNNGIMMCKCCNCKKFIMEARFELVQKVKRDDVSRVVNLLHGNAERKRLTMLLCKQCKYQAYLTEGLDATNHITERIFVSGLRKVDNDVGYLRFLKQQFDVKRIA